MSDEAFVKEVTKVDQSIDELSDFLDADPKQVKDMLRDLKDYGSINSMSDSKVLDLFSRFDKILSNTHEVYGELVADQSMKNTPEASVYKKLNEVKQSFREAGSRESRVIAIDKLINLAHAHGSNILPYGYGVADTDRGSEFMQRVLDWLRNQKVYK